MESENVFRRGGVWQFRMRVPKEFAHLDKRTFVKFSLKTHDRVEALVKATEAKERFLSLWMAQSCGQSTGLDSFEQIVRHCRSLGFSYKPLEDLTDEEFMARAMATLDAPPESAIAALGLADDPSDTTASLMEFFEDARRAENSNKSDFQMEKWRAPFLRAIELFNATNGIKPVKDVCRADAIAVHSKLLDRIEAAEIGASSANRIMGSLSSMWSTYAKRSQWEQPNPFRGLHIKERRKQLRPPVPDEFVRQIVKPGALDGMNGECKAILLTLINTGCRPSEVIGLRKEHIHLQHNNPHIQIKPEGRDLKTSESERDMPLIGVALEAMRQYPDGFARYRETPTNATATINKFLKARKLVPAGCTCYGFRHSFQDRLTSSDVQERMARDLMGHRLQGERYGEGATLEHKARILDPISFK